jgi:hypothetical protein
MWRLWIGIGWGWWWGGPVEQWSTAAQLLSKAPILSNKWGTEYNITGLVKYVSNGKILADFFAISALPNETLESWFWIVATLFLRWDGTASETFWVIWDPIDLADESWIILPINAGDILQTGAMPLITAIYLNFSWNDMTIGVDEFINDNGADIFSFPYFAEEEEVGWPWKIIVNNGWLELDNFIGVTYSSDLVFYNQWETVDIDFIDWTILEDWEEFRCWVVANDWDLQLVPAISKWMKKIAAVEIENNTGNPFEFWVDNLTDLTINGVFAFTGNGWWGWGAVWYNYIIDRSDFIFMPEVWEIIQTQVWKVYVDGVLHDLGFPNLPNFSLNTGEAVFVLGKFDWAPTWEITTDVPSWNFDNDWLPVVLMTFRNNGGMFWSYGTQATNMVSCDIESFIWNAKWWNNQNNTEDSIWYRLQEGNVTENTDWTLWRPVRLEISWLLNVARFLNDNTYMSLPNFGWDMLTPFDWDRTWYIGTQSTGWGNESTFNSKQIDKNTGQWNFGSGSQFQNIQLVLRQIPIWWDKVVIGWQDGLWVGWMAIATSDFNWGITISTEIVSWLDTIRQIAVKLDDDRFAIVHADMANVYTRTYNVSGTTITIDDTDTVVGSMTGAELDSLTRGNNFRGAIVQTGVDKFVMFPTWTGSAYVVDTSSWITSWQNGVGSATTAYKSVVWLDWISRLLLIQNEFTNTNWYIIWISWVSLTFGSETWLLDSSSIEYKVESFWWDNVAIVWIIENWDDSGFKTYLWNVTTSQLLITGQVNNGQKFPQLDWFLNVRNLYFINNDNVSSGFLFWGTQILNPSQWWSIVFHSQLNDDYQYWRLNDFYTSDIVFPDYVWIIRNIVTRYSAGIPITYVQVVSLWSYLKNYSISQNGSNVYINSLGDNITSAPNNFIAGIQYSNWKEYNIYLNKNLDNEVTKTINTDFSLDTGSDTLNVPYWARYADNLLISYSSFPWTFEIDTITWLEPWYTYQLIPDAWCELELITTPVASASADEIIYWVAWPVIVDASKWESAYIRVAGNGMIELIGVNNFI